MRIECAAFISSAPCDRREECNLIPIRNCMVQLYHDLIDRDKHVFLPQDFSEDRTLAGDQRANKFCNRINAHGLNPGISNA